MTHDDPYRNLIIAIVARATEDAEGHCVYSGMPERDEAEARAWLRHPHDGAILLELAGFDSAPILRQIHRAIGR